MKVSIITVCFNSEETIDKAINSVLSQSHKDIEYIIIDGESKDKTIDLVRRYISKLSFFKTEPDEGIYDAFNKGIELATGDVICFLNSDDIYTSTHVISKIASAFATTDVDIIYGDVIYHNKQNPSKVIRRYKSGNFSIKRLAWGWMPAHPSVFMRRGVYDTYGNFKKNYKIAGDYEFFCRIMKGGQLKSMYFPEAFVNMRAGGVSTSGFKNTYILNSEVVRACRENGINTSIFRILSKYPLKLLEIFSH